MSTAPPTEDFLVFLEDKKFTDKSSFFSKDFGSSVAATVRGKIAKKIGSTNVMAISDAKKPGIKRCLIPTAASRLNSIYRAHPIDKTRYILITEFHELILNEKREEFCNLLKSVGCKFISWRKHPEWNKSYLSPDNTLQQYASQGDDLEKKFRYFKTASTWQKVIPLFSIVSFLPLFC